MQYYRLGPSDIVVSAIALGTMNFGPLVSGDEADRMLSIALDRGISLVDTASVYGGPRRGTAEEYIGRWLAGSPIRRDQVVLATKVYFSTDETMADGLAPRNIVISCDQSLRRLRTDYIDIYQLHHPDLGQRWEDIAASLDMLITQGKIRSAGSSNFAAWHIAQFNERSIANEFPATLIAEQSPYNLLERTVELEVLPACASYGMSFLAYSPLAGGVLGGQGNRGESARRRLSSVVQRQHEMHAELHAYERLCLDLGESPACVGISWLLQRPQQCIPIVGPRTTDQLLQLLYASEYRLPPSALSRLDEIFPGPGGPAPQAYAW